MANVESESSAEDPAAGERAAALVKVQLADSRYGAALLKRKRLSSLSWKPASLSETAIENVLRQSAFATEHSTAR